MHRMLVDEKKWVEESRFLHALNFCMLLPGPEAQKLATYVGWLLHGTRGGLAAGILFVLPGALVMLGVSLLYALGQRHPGGRRRALRHQGGGAGDRGRGAAAHRPPRASRRACCSASPRRPSSASSSSPLPFPLIVARRRRWPASSRTRALPRRPPVADARALAPCGARAALVGLALWSLPVALVVLLLGTSHVLVDIGPFFSKLAVVSFGGAYALLAYMAQQAVETYGWMSAPEMVDGLGLAETRPDRSSW